MIKRCYELKEKLKALSGAPLTGAHAEWKPAEDLAGMVAQGEQHGIPTLHADEDLRSVILIPTFGLKGMAAYMDHSMIQGKTDDGILAFFQRALAATTDQSLGLLDYIGLVMECGKQNLTVMGLLDEANTGKLRQSRSAPELLKQTEGKGVNIYTHGEMIPAHAYPGLKKYPHLVGNFGGAWQDQAKEFVNFPGAIIFNTN